MKLIEIDVDGVLGNIHGSLGPYLTDIYPGFDGDKHITSWGMKELNDINTSLRPRILKLFNNPEFILNMPVFDGVPKALNSLKKAADKAGFEIIINSNSYKPCIAAKKKWLQKLLSKASVEILCRVTSDSVKSMLDSYVVVEDNPDNLKASKAPYKILIRRGHNRFASLKDLGEFKKAFICNDFVDAEKIIESIIENL